MNKTNKQVNKEILSKQQNARTRTIANMQANRSVNKYRNEKTNETNCSNMNNIKQTNKQKFQPNSN